MKREEYLNQLKLNLENNEFGPVEEAIAYFNELLDDRMVEEGMDEETAVSNLEAPEQVAKQLVQSQPRTQRAPEADTTKGPRLNTRVINPNLVRRIHIQDRNMRLVVEGWDRDEIQLRHPESDKIQYDYSLENGVLSLVRHKVEFSIRLFQFEWLDRQMQEVSLYVPRDLAAELDLRTSNSLMRIVDLHCWGTAFLRTSNSNLEATDCSAKAFQVQTSNGALKLKGLKTQGDCMALTSNGNINAVDIEAKGQVSLHTSNGAIKVESIRGTHLDLSSSNGAIQGILPGKKGDYTICALTSLGKSSLPQQQTGGVKHLSVHTSNARIAISFQEGEPQESSQSGGEGWVDTLVDDTMRIGQKVSDAVSDKFENLGGNWETALDKGLEKVGDFGEHLAKTVEDALARTFDTKAKDPGTPPPSPEE